RQAAPRALVDFWSCKSRLDFCNDTFAKVAPEAFVGGGVGCRMRRFITVDPGLGGYEVAADPRPDRSEDRARDAAWALVCRIVVDEERLQRCEEGPRGIPGSGRRPPRFAQRSAHLLK